MEATITATGYTALNYNTTGEFNTATGHSALYSNTTGYFNTADGISTLYKNTIGYEKSDLAINKKVWDKQNKSQDNELSEILFHTKVF